MYHPFSVEVFSVDECRDDLGDLFSLPLRGHMANSVHSHELEIVVIDLVARGLLVGDPLPPLVGHGPVLSLDPSPGSKSGYGTVSVAREEHHLVAIGLEDGIDPHRSLVLQMVLEAVVAVASGPAWGGGRDVHSGSHIGSVDVVTHGGTE